MISIVIPLYNKEGLIADTLRSVLAQTYRDFEIVIVNDGSTDHSIDEVAKFTDPRIRMINQANAGVSAARNRGIAEAKGDYIALLDADDEWKPDYLETQFEMSRKYPECTVFATDYIFRSALGKNRPTKINNLPFSGDTGILSNYFEVAAESHPPLWTSAVVVRKDAFESVGGFPVGIKSGEDLLTWARLACRYKIAYCRKPLAVFVFDEVIFNEDQKARDVSIGDEVGKELKVLYRQHKMPGIRQYIALWYKMRGRIYLTKGHRGKAFREIAKSMRYSLNTKIICFMVMCFLPDKLIHKIFNRFG